jgi:hypothetical protein
MSILSINRYIWWISVRWISFRWIFVWWMFVRWIFVRWIIMEPRKIPQDLLFPRKKSYKSRPRSIRSLNLQQQHWSCCEFFKFRKHLHIWKLRLFLRFCAASIHNTGIWQIVGSRICEKKLRSKHRHRQLRREQESKNGTRKASFWIRPVYTNNDFRVKSNLRPTPTIGSILLFVGRRWNRYM